MTLGGFSHLPGQSERTVCRLSIAQARVGISQPECNKAAHNRFARGQTVEGLLRNLDDLLRWITADAGHTHAEQGRVGGDQVANRGVGTIWERFV